LASSIGVCTGKGTQVWKKTGAVYDGDWKDNMRHGFGMYSIKKGDAYVKQYAGGWKEDMRDVSCITYVRTYLGS